MNARLFATDVISSKISDHRPIVHNDVLFWNIMMQGKARQNRGFNNGFGIVETDKQYIQRLCKVAAIIADIVANNPGVRAISLCEGPVKLEHVTAFIAALESAESLQRFFTDKRELHQPEVPGFHNWGLMLLADARYKVEPVTIPGIEGLIEYPKLINRLQLWHLSSGAESKYIALGHFPYAEDVHVNDKSGFTQAGHSYCKMIENLLHNYANKDFILCADFNFNPMLISAYQNHHLDNVPSHNSIVMTDQQKPVSVTVDGVLLSNLNKQKIFAGITQTGLFSRAVKEWQWVREMLLEQRHSQALSLICL